MSRPPRMTVSDKKVERQLARERRDRERQERRTQRRADKAGRAARDPAEQIGEVMTT